MSEQLHDVTITLSLDDDASPQELDRATTQLYQTLMQSDADSIERAHGQTIREGAKGDEITVATLLLAFGPALAPSIIRVIYNWFRRFIDNEEPENASLTVQMGKDRITITMDDLSSTEKIDALKALFELRS